MTARPNYAVLGGLTFTLVIAGFIETMVLSGEDRWPFDEPRPTMVTVKPLAVEGDRQPLFLPDPAGTSGRTGGEPSRVLAARYRIPAGWAVQKHTLRREKAGTITIAAWQVSPGVPTGDDAGRRRAAVLAARLGTDGSEQHAKAGPATTRTVSGRPAVEVAVAYDSSPPRWEKIHTYVFTGRVVVEVICAPASAYDGWSDEIRRGCAAVLATLEVPQ